MLVSISKPASNVLIQYRNSLILETKYHPEGKEAILKIIKEEIQPAINILLDRGY